MGCSTKGVDYRNLPCLPGHDLAEVGNGREAAQHFVDQAEVRAANVGIGIEHHHLVEERIDHRPQRRDLGRAPECRRAPRAASQPWAPGRPRRREGPALRGELDAESAEPITNLLFFGLAQNVLDSLEGCGDGGEVLRAAHRGESFGAGDGVAHVVGAGGQHRVHYVVGEAAHVLQVEVQALAEERRETCCSTASHRPGWPSTTSLERQRQIRLGEDLHDGIGCAAQRKGILRSRRRVADAEHRRDGLDAVGEAEQLAFDGLRNRIFSRGRRVLVVDGLRHGFAKALRARVESADDALQFSEFLDQFGGEVGLGRVRRP